MTSCEEENDAERSDDDAQDSYHGVGEEARGSRDGEAAPG